MKRVLLSTSEIEFVQIYDNVLSKADCEFIINTCEEYGTFSDSRIGSGSSYKVNKDIRNSQSTWVQDELTISPASKKYLWAKIDQLLFDAIGQSINMYVEKFDIFNFTDELEDSGYQIQSIPMMSGFYGWHFDSGTYLERLRLFTMLIYFNEVEVGGETEFKYLYDVDENRLRIKPKTGSVLVMPCSWVYEHRGRPPIADNKWIMTTFVHQKYPETQKPSAELELY